MAERKHKSRTAVIVVIVAGTGAIVAYLWYRDKKQASASSATSSGLGSSVPLADVAVNPVEQPNSYSATPVIQNYSQVTTNVSSQPVIVHAFSKQRPPRPHPPHSPHMGGR